LKRRNPAQATGRRAYLLGFALGGLAILLVGGLCLHLLGASLRSEPKHEVSEAIPASLNATIESKKAAITNTKPMPAKESATPIAPVVAKATPPRLVRRVTEPVNHDELPLFPVDPPKTTAGPENTVSAKRTSPEPAPTDHDQAKLEDQCFTKAPPPAARIVDANVGQSCEQFGTAIHFITSPVEAFKKAHDENKLVFMMHLSGNFEDKGFT
jgi:hypothetical protein